MDFRKNRKKISEFLKTVNKNTGYQFLHDKLQLFFFMQGLKCVSFIAFPILFFTFIVFLFCIVFLCLFVCLFVFYHV